jgi:dTDP-4-dehydrorhamnose 3,5-epimerase
MIFRKTKLRDAFIIDIEELTDERGFFARGWCRNEFEKHGLVSNVVQANISYNRKKGTLRGMHYQVAPHEESKLMRCTRGAIYDVIVDLRTDSSTYRQWIGVELTAESHRMLFVPEGFAHGFQSLEDETEVFYQVSEFYTPSTEHGLRYNDPTFQIQWPLNVSLISEKDANWPDFLTCRS